MCCIVWQCVAVYIRPRHTCDLVLTNSLTTWHVFPHAHTQTHTHTHTQIHIYTQISLIKFCATCLVLEMACYVALPKDGVGMNDSCHTYELGISHLWMRHSIYMNESCHTFEWVMSHVYMRHVTHIHIARIIIISLLLLSHMTHHVCNMCDMKYSYVWHDLFISVTWLIHVRDVTPSYMWHDSSRYKICVTRNIRTCDMTPFICRWDPLAGLELHSVQVQAITTVPCITTLNTAGSRVELHKKCKN